ncbi:hypothetical protein [Polyangium sp. y55x31]|uniref:hypothetical protein n=1 Tax=Polyangium sp. y55x31 TaxID=3042688 RepID=UPI002482C634|nr:hypothetical protein [Polyangium sp. y55x31]MDI1483945.1 hypothetical protein [Polyangium sp. y55x31]
MNLRTMLPHVFLVLALTVPVVACDETGNGGAGAGGGGQGGNGGNGGNGGQGGGGGQGGQGGMSASSSGSASGGSGGMGGAGGAAFDCANLPLCDDFEAQAAGQAPDPARWAVVMPNCMGSGTAAVDATQAHSGKNSVLVTGKGGYCNHVFISHAAAFAELGDVVYGRFYLRMSADQGDGHTTFMAMRDENDGPKDLRMGGQSKILMWNRESDDATLPSLSPTGIGMSVPLTADKWRCIEFQVDQAAGALRTWVDGNEVAGLVIDGTPTPDVDQQWITQKPNWKPKVTDLKLGWESYAGQDMNLWFDDVALATTRIGCQ